jgi:hypothetical protein
MIIEPIKRGGDGEMVTYEDLTADQHREIEEKVARFRARTIATAIKNAAKPPKRKLSDIKREFAIRRAAILARKREGASNACLAREYEVSVSQIRMILMKALREEFRSRGEQAWPDARDEYKKLLRRGRNYHGCEGNK